MTFSLDKLGAFSTIFVLKRKIQYFCRGNLNFFFAGVNYFQHFIQLPCLILPLCFFFLWFSTFLSSIPNLRLKALIGFNVWSVCGFLFSSQSTFTKIMIQKRLFIFLFIKYQIIVTRYLQFQKKLNYRLEKKLNVSYISVTTEDVAKKLHELWHHIQDLKEPRQFFIVPNFRSIR